ncbi:hypothetical protein FEM48_Zijuj01G0167300 [Ziziphus jujuba var. spinosa]|uniref:Uncharacterized protein n=1 Tax=Ziziphus jujuba var. spinosa TaxID=714518 RepID=A0A978W2E0_ZIZJJ|nr:hypothetical protein FEM48_Zijuj01G0167300 [Ziziphus jujuba var. spinosa]
MKKLKMIWTKRRIERREVLRSIRFGQEKSEAQLMKPPNDLRRVSKLDAHPIEQKVEGSLKLRLKDRASGKSVSKFSHGMKLGGFIHQVVIEEDIERLFLNPSLSEVWEIAQSMNPMNAPYPNGLFALFF